MGNMNFTEFKEKLFDAARKKGFTDFEIFYTSGENFGVTVYRGEIDNYSVNATRGLGFRGIFEGKMGYSYTEILDDEAVDLLVENAKVNATIIDDEDKEEIFAGSEKYSNINCYNEELDDISADRKIELAMEMEKTALEEDKRVKDVRHCSVHSFAVNVSLVNSKGLELSHRTNAIYAMLSPVVEENGKTNTAMEFIATRNLRDFNVHNLAKEAVRKSLSFIGAKPVRTGKYMVILNNETASDILETYSSIFSAERVQKGMSLLKDKTGKMVGSKALTITEYPLMENGMVSAPFDGEGVACYKKEVIKEGQLVTLLYNLKAAAKDGVKSTGNASRPSYASTIDIAPSNFYIKPGELELEALCQKMHNGLLITEVQGLHSGANTISGDFSLAAKGFEIVNGKISRPVEQITIAGNFYKMMEDVIEVGKDLRFGVPSGVSSFGSPALLIRELSVAGLND